MEAKFENGYDLRGQAPVVQKVGNTIHGIKLITIHWIAQFVFLTPVSWILIYPVDSTIQLFNN